MKMKLFLVSCALLISTNIFAKKYEGFVVRINGDTLKGLIVFSDFSIYKSTYKKKIQILSKNRIKMELNGKKLVFFPRDIIQYSLKIGNEWETYWSVNTEREGLFMKKIARGALDLYFCTTYHDFTFKYHNHFVFVKKDSKENLYLRYGVTSNKKKIIEFLKECKIIEEKISKKEIKVGKLHHWELISELYNEQCN